MTTPGTFNKLGAEKSPYLLQHRGNPVWWHPWGDAAFERARSLDRPIFLSIGYSTCYWCHVMEHDSFEHDDVAAVLNEHFVSIKVDREERPDVDQIYMDAVTAVTGRGGWPMSVFLTPDLKPFHGGTFWYRSQFVQILSAIGEAWRMRRDELVAAAAELTRRIVHRSLPAAPLVPRYDAVLARTFHELLSRFDEESGGFGGAPKFPPAVQLRVLLRALARNKEARAAVMVEKTLRSMAHGGINDQLGGGFHRYSTDAGWIVPHFEKMLYDNALLVVTYLEGASALGAPWCGEVARETLDFLLREFELPEGGFAAALDAGPVGREGEYYVWDPEELADPAGRYFDFTLEGNFEAGKVIPVFRVELSWESRRDPEFAALRESLMHRRKERAYPHRDDKLLTSWNALAVVAFALGGEILDEPRYRDAAVRTASFIRDMLWNGDRLLRRWCDGEAAHDGCAEDYAYSVHGFLTLFECRGERPWLDVAIAVQARQDELLWDEQRGAYRTSTAPELIHSKFELHDNATPSPNGVALGNLARLSRYTGDRRAAARCERLAAALGPVIERIPHGSGSALLGLDLLAGLAGEAGPPRNAGCTEEGCDLPGVLTAAETGLGAPIRAGGRSKQSSSESN